MRFRAIAAAWILSSAAALVPAAARHPDTGPATRAIYVDAAGVVRWRDSNDEVALFGANYCIMSGSDYRMAGLVGGDRRR